MKTLAKYHVRNHCVILVSYLGPFLESPGNLSGPISVFGDKCFLTNSFAC